MPRTFAYLRVSTTGQTTDNQLQEIAAAGFKVEPRRVVTQGSRIRVCSPMLRVGLEMSGSPDALLKPAKG